MDVGTAAMQGTANYCVTRAALGSHIHASHQHTQGLSEHTQKQDSVFFPSRQKFPHPAAAAHHTSDFDSTRSHAVRY